jgi:hypothetical protein
MCFAAYRAHLVFPRLLPLVLLHHESNVHDLIFVGCCREGEFLYPVQRYSDQTCKARSVPNVDGLGLFSRAESKQTKGIIFHSAFDKLYALQSPQVSRMSKLQWPLHLCLLPMSAQ